MSLQITVSPKEGDAVAITKYDGELRLSLTPSVALNSIELNFPVNPDRASRIVISTTQSIKTIVPNVSIPLTSMTENDQAGFVWCSITKTYLSTGLHSPGPTKTTKNKFIQWFMNLFKKKNAAV